MVLGYSVFSLNSQVLKHNIFMGILPHAISTSQGYKEEWKMRERYKDALKVQRKKIFFQKKGEKTNINHFYLLQPTSRIVTWILIFCKLDTPASTGCKHRALSWAWGLKILIQEQSCHSFTPTSAPAQLLDKYLSLYKKNLSPWGAYFHM